MAPSHIYTHLRDDLVFREKLQILWDRWIGNLKTRKLKNSGDYTALEAGSPGGAARITHSIQRTGAITTSGHVDYYLVPVAAQGLGAAVPWQLRLLMPIGSTRQLIIEFNKIDASGAETPLDSVMFVGDDTAKTLQTTEAFAPGDIIQTRVGLVSSCGAAANLVVTLALEEAA